MNMKQLFVRLATYTTLHSAVYIPQERLIKRKRVSRFLYRCVLRTSRLYRSEAPDGPIRNDGWNNSERWCIRHMMTIKRAQAQRTASARATSERWSEGMYKKKHMIQKQRCKRSPPGAPLCLKNTAHPGPVGSPQPQLLSLCRKRRLRPRR